VSDRKASRRDLFRLLGRSLAEFAEEKTALPAGAGKTPASRAAPSAPAAEVPVERGRLVIDLAVHPVPVHRGRRFRGAGWEEPILVVRVTPEHYAAVSGDCPHCGGPLAFDLAADVARCPRGEAAFRMDGVPTEGAPDRELRVYVARAAGPRLEVAVI